MEENDLDKIKRLQPKYVALYSLMFFNLLLFLFLLLSAAVSFYQGLFILGASRVVGGMCLMLPLGFLVLILEDNFNNR